MLALSVDFSDMKFYLSRDKSRSWRGKSINEQITILSLNSVDRILRKKSILKKVTSAKTKYLRRLGQQHLYPL